MKLVAILLIVGTLVAGWFGGKAAISNAQRALTVRAARERGQ